MRIIRTLFWKQRTRNHIVNSYQMLKEQLSSKCTNLYVSLCLTVLWLRQLEGFNVIAHHRAEKSTTCL